MERRRLCPPTESRHWKAWGLSELLSVTAHDIQAIRPSTTTRNGCQLQYSLDGESLLVAMKKERRVESQPPRHDPVKPVQTVPEIQ
jgi:hypothetical protein